MRKVFLLFCLMMAIAVSAQSEEWIPDSVAVDSASVDTEERMDIEEVEWNDRYAVSEKDGKCAIFDIIADSLVTDLIFDEAFPAYRKRVFDEYITYFSIKQGDRLGIVGIFEDTNTTTIILAPPSNQNARKNQEDNVKAKE